MKCASTISGISLSCSTVLLEQLRVLERDADVGADVEAHHLGVDDQAAPENHARLVELADALVNGGAGDAAFAGDLQKRHARILDEVFEDVTEN